MKLLPLSLLLSTLWVLAAERYATADSPKPALDAFARAAKQAPLQVSDEGELRVWVRDYMSGSVGGYLISRHRSVICRMTSTYENGVVTLGKPSCRKSSNGQKARRAAELLPSFAKSEWDCPVDDGIEVYLEHVHAGKRSVARVGNPGFCRDSDSRAIAALLEKLP